MGQSGDDERFYNKLIRGGGTVCQHPHPHHHHPHPQLHSKAGTQRCNTAPSEGETPHWNAKQPRTPEVVFLLFCFFFFPCPSVSLLLVPFEMHQRRTSALQAKSAAFKGQRRTVVPQHLRQTDGQTDGAHEVWIQAGKLCLDASICTSLGSWTHFCIKLQDNQLQSVRMR